MNHDQAFDAQPAATPEIRSSIEPAIDAAIRAIPPAWPLHATVAVNPFLGQSGESLAVTAARLARVAGATVTMPREWYRRKIDEGRITDDDLADALAQAPAERRPADVATLRRGAQADAQPPQALETVADLAAEASGTDWPAIIADRIGAWAAGYFDDGQALWAAPRANGPYAAWRMHATHDLAPEILGLDGFARRVAETPDAADRTIDRVVARLGLDADALQTYFHRLLMTLGGWAQQARYRLWEAELDGRGDPLARDLLAIRLLFEEALLDQLGERIASRWTAAAASYAAPADAGANHWTDAILQHAAERAEQRRLAGLLNEAADCRNEAADASARPRLQAAFCIDVRSEVYRRALESLDPAIRTLGFAGFFGLPVAHRRFASDVAERRLPVLLRPALTTCATGADDAERDLRTRLILRAKRAWGRFKFAAVSSFAFVEAMGPVYIGRLLRDGLGLRAAGWPDDPPPRPDPALAAEERIDAAEQVLRAMSLTEGFGRVVVLAGHGSRVTNNPHASALQCGACGGYSGEVNARLLAGLLNDAEVRAGLAERGIVVPDDTLFVGALHDTATDSVRLYTADVDDAGHTEDLATIFEWLRRAGALARAERTPSLPGAERSRGPERRSRDWAELRPEWGLAGCSAFIAAPRARTTPAALNGRAFLHDYHWRRDEDFQVLELILTAPVVVASWISLQYYGSVVAPGVFGGGNKTLHNIVGGIGVVEGNGGALRVGLPWQSVHDGERPMHDPLRLTVCVEAPTEAIGDILQRHADVRALFDNGWLHLFALDDAGRMAYRYAGQGRWEDSGYVPVGGEAQEPAARAAG
jgi:hypothetical protein